MSDPGGRMWIRKRERWILRSEEEPFYFPQTRIVGQISDNTKKKKPTKKEEEEEFLHYATHTLEIQKILKRETLDSRSCNDWNIKLNVCDFKIIIQNPFKLLLVDEFLNDLDFYYGVTTWNGLLVSWGLYVS